LFNFFKKKERQSENTFTYIPPEPERVLFESSFEEDLCGWNARGGAPIELSLTSETRHSGSSCLKITGRDEGWQGASLDITKYMGDGLRHYEAMVWVKVPDDTPSCRVCLSLEVNSRIGSVVFPYYDHWDDYDGVNRALSKYRLPVNGKHDKNIEEWETAYPDGYVTKDGWVLLHGKVKINHAEHFRAYVYIETNNQGANSDIYIDDFVLLRGAK